MVDLLGRQQIADVPTALGELFKNAIDAGASSVRLDLWPEFGCLSASDNGLGMRKEEDLLQRWMVLATESKHGPPSSDWTLYATEKQEQGLQKKAFGEKGIGRLAMALLGTGTLVWTRWGKGSEMQRTLLLVPWTVFKHSGLTLDQIRLPMLSLDRDATTDDALRLVDELEEWFQVDLLQSVQVTPGLKAEVETDFLAFRRALSAPLKFPSTMGTSFTVLGTSDIVSSHFDGWLVKTDLFSDETSKDSEGRESYLAFSNKFLPHRTRLDISLYESGREYSLAEENFWIPEDFDLVDHCIDAVIDTNGFVRATVRVGNEVHHHESQLSVLPKRARPPGKLRFKLGYVEGDKQNSILHQEDWVLYAKRLEKFGGFFVYMDDIRVQPYGRANEDFLEFEKRRSLNAGRYFFSHRRMFGGLFLSGDDNAALVEKAGREGFQQTGAYRGMVFWLRAFFVELSDTYFGRKADRLDKMERAEERRRRQREEREAEEKRHYDNELNRSRQRLDSEVSKFNVQYEKFAHFLRTVGDHATDNQQAQLRLLVEDLRSCYEHLWDGFVLAPPSFYTPDPRQAEVIDSYLHKKQTKDDEARKLLTSASEKLGTLIRSTQSNEEKEASQDSLLKAHRQRIEAFLHDAAKPSIIASRNLPNSILRQVRSFVGDLSTSTDTLLEKGGDEGRYNVSLEERMAREHRLAQEFAELHFGNLTKFLNSLANGDDSLLDIHDLREEIRAGRERESRLLELAQLGLVIESVDHDYHAMLGNIDNAIELVRQNLPKERIGILESLITGVEHLDERLQFWDPLVRRSGSSLGVLTGEDIRNFIQGVMDHHSRQQVRMEYTPKFLRCSISDVKRSSFLGAVHNIVMNAGYWCTKNTQEGAVRFSMHEEGIIISDSGPGVTDRDRRQVFEPGFSRRPLGRGLGLFIARSTLTGFGFGLRLLDVPASGALPGANFLITLSSRN